MAHVSMCRLRGQFEVAPSRQGRCVICAIKEKDTYGTCAICVVCMRGTYGTWEGLKARGLVARCVNVPLLHPFFSRSS